MNTRYLLSHKIKPVGWVLLCIGLILGIVLLINDFEYPKWEFHIFSLIGGDSTFSSAKNFSWGLNNVSDEIAAILIIVGGILVAFSKTKEEDEYITKIRMESLIWATYVNYIVLLLAIIFVFDLGFFNVMIVNMFTILLFFIFRFHFMLFKTNSGIKNEE